VRIFVYEHITGGGFAESPLPAALLCEALLMVRALAADLRDTGARVCVLCDRRVDLGLHGIDVQVVQDGVQAQTRFDALLSASDAAWLIAPETDGVLERVSQRALRAGVNLLSCHPDGVHVAASKLATAQVLQAAGVPAIATFRPDAAPAAHAIRWVAKPDDGCGCEDTRLVADLRAAAAWIGTCERPERFVVQPFVAGQVLSLSAIARGDRAWLLSVNRQSIDLRGDRFHFAGVLVNAVTDETGQCQRLAQRIVQAIPGLHGYFGLDLVRTEGGPIVLEVNPRLTTSYAGLRAALGINPAAVILERLQDRPADWHPLPPGESVAIALPAA